MGLGTVFCIVSRPATVIADGLAQALTTPTGLGRIDSGSFTLARLMTISAKIVDRTGAGVIAGEPLPSVGAL